MHSVESAIARAFTRYSKAMEPSKDTVALARCRWKVNLIITGCVYKNSTRGWLHYFRQMDDLTLLKSLDATVDRFIARFELPESFKTKRFMRAYWQILDGKYKTVSNSYIPNFDLTTMSEMRAFVGYVMGYNEVESLSDTEIRRLFDKFIGKTVAELEEDIGFIS